MASQREVYRALMKEYREKALAAANRYMIDVNETIEKLPPENQILAGMVAHLIPKIVNSHSEAILESLSIFLSDSEGEGNPD